MGGRWKSDEWSLLTASSPRVSNLWSCARLRAHLAQLYQITVACEKSGPLHHPSPLGCQATKFPLSAPFSHPIRTVETPTPFFLFFFFLAGQAAQRSKKAPHAVPAPAPALYPNPPNPKMDNRPETWQPPGPCPVQTRFRSRTITSHQAPFHPSLSRPNP